MFIVCLCYQLFLEAPFSYFVISLPELQPAELRIHGATGKSTGLRNGSNADWRATSTGLIPTAPSIRLPGLHVRTSYV